jgi:UDP-glucose 4-epimerase
MPSIIEVHHFKLKQRNNPGADSMKILVTGALGFIGSNLTERLIKEGHDVTALDNFHTGSEENAAAFKENIKLLDMKSGDIGTLDDKFDVIFHNGIPSSCPMYAEDPHLVASVQDEWISILEYSRKNNSRIVFASTSSLYNGITPPHKENIVPLITDFYSEARIGMERLGELYHKLYSIPIIGLRYFSVYGPHEKAKKGYANLITQFLWAMKEGNRPLIYGDGSQTRDFTYVDDIVEANILALDHDGFGIFNVGTGMSISLNEMVKLLNKKLNTNLEPTYQENPISNYVAHTLADTNKAEKELGFKAKVSLEEGIDKLIEHYQ